MKKVLYLSVIYFIFVLSNLSVKGMNDGTNVHLIFNKVSFSAGEEIRLNINLENYSNLNETKVIIKCDETIFKPVEKNGKYGHLVNNSIYDDILVNEYDSGYLRFHLIKKDISSGYYSGYKNNVGEFYFIASRNISNIYEYFSSGSFNILSSGISVTLYDIYNELIPSRINYSEKIKVEWNESKYVLEVFSNKPNYFEDIVVLNRTSDEYELMIKEEINMNTLGSSIINIIVIDKTNSDFLMLSKSVDVVDTTKPVVTGCDNINIDSNKLDLFVLDEYYEVSDNYDDNLNVFIKYYGSNNTEFINFDELKDYLKHNLNACIEITTVDSSGNKSDIFYINVHINDVTAPNIAEISSFDVLDYNLSSFQINDLFEVIDDYDLFPTLSYKCLVDGKDVEDFKKELIKNNKVTVIYYACDNRGNKTNEYRCILKIEDTTNPVIKIVESIKLTDKEIPHFDFLSIVSITDNIDLKPKVIMEYYAEDKKYEFHNWVDKVCSGKSSYILYYGIDESGNKTETVKINLEVVDTTMPIIEVDNVKNGGKYIVGKVINYSVVDNFSDNLEVSVLLNNIIYNKEEIIKPGEYTLKIEAIDEAGNKNIVIISFQVIENNFIGCGGDIDCYKDNYFEIVLLSIILLIVIIMIFVIKLLISNKKRKRAVNVIKNDE